ncbi:MAG TPA: hypothetical protein DC049_17690 [Spirochaetia bacterium]|nr:hypothetical protein [Spirochaetia bacterium]
MKNKPLIRIAFVIFILLLLIPAFRLLFLYIKIFNKSYTIEIDTYRNKIKKYAFGAGQDIQTAALGSEKEFLGEINAAGMTPDELFEQQRGEIEISENLANINNFYNSELRLNEEKEMREVKKSMEKLPLRLGGDSSSIIGNISDFRILHTYDDSGIVDEKNEDFRQSPEDKLNAEFDKNADNFTIYLNNKYTKKNNLPVTQFKVINQNKFYTSPHPSSDMMNSAKILNQLELVVSKDQYYRFELIRMNLIAKNKINVSDLRVVVMYGSYIIPNTGGANDVEFRYRNNQIVAAYAPGYNPPLGNYTILVKSKSNPDWPGLAAAFQIIAREVPAIPKGFSVVNMEWTVPVNGYTVPGVDGSSGNFENIIEWAAFMDADAFWMLTAQTTGWNPEISAKNPWTSGGFKNLELLAPVAHRKNILMGAYIMTYYTPGNGKKYAGYDPSLGYDRSTGRLTDSYHVSIACDKRYRDIVNIASEFQKNDNVDFIGFDFIRTGHLDGYENGPQVVEDMNIKVPKSYYDMPYLEKIKWFAKKIRDNDDLQTIIKWRWWRAQRVASIINQVILDARITKPVWVFTLGWEHGKQHGQDPYMFFDAGVTIDAVMLYEASETQFRNLMVQWPNYMRDHRNNVIVGNACDVRLLDGRSGHPPLEYYWRTLEGYKKIYRSSQAKGIFFHDISRALWSSKRGIPVNEWAIINGAAVSRLREECGVHPLLCSVSFGTDNAGGVIEVKNQSDRIVNDININYIPAQYWAAVELETPFISSIAPGETRRIKFRAQVHERFNKSHALLGFYLSAPGLRKNFAFSYRSEQSIMMYVMN